jgi:hypothetical protein
MLHGKAPGVLGCPAPDPNFVEAMDAGQRFQMSFRLDTTAEQGEDPTVRRRQVLSYGCRYGGRAHFRDKPTIYDRERLTGVWPGRAG